MSFKQFRFIKHPLALLYIATYDWVKSEANFYLIDIPHEQLSNTDLLHLVNSGNPLKLQGQKFQNTRFSYLSLEDSNFKHSSLINCSFESTNCTGSNFDNCIVSPILFFHILTKWFILR